MSTFEASILKKQLEITKKELNQLKIKEVERQQTASG